MMIKYPTVIQLLYINFVVPNLVLDHPIWPQMLPCKLHKLCKNLCRFDQTYTSSSKHTLPQCLCNWEDRKLRHHSHHRSAFRFLNTKREIVEGGAYAAIAHSKAGKKPADMVHQLRNASQENTPLPYLGQCLPWRGQPQVDHLTRWNPPRQVALHASELWLVWPRDPLQGLPCRKPFLYLTYRNLWTCRTDKPTIFFNY